MLSPSNAFFIKIKGPFFPNLHREVKVSTLTTSKRDWKYPARVSERKLRSAATVRVSCKNCPLIVFGDSLFLWVQMLHSSPADSACENKPCAKDNTLNSCTLEKTVQDWSFSCILLRHTWTTSRKILQRENWFLIKMQLQAIWQKLQTRYTSRVSGCFTEQQRSWVYIC